jgi:hypothetical protein
MIGSICVTVCSKTVFKRKSQFLQASLIFSYVAKYLSREIILNELSTIKSVVAKEAEFNDENLEIKINDYNREVITKYRVDEGQFNEMSIRLPPSYPLAEVEIVGVSRVGVNLERWNKWLLTCKIACKVPRVWSTSLC